ncbi:30S ribosomal protein [Dirofilaria immitis]
MTDADVYYIGNLVLNGTGDGQSPQMLSLVPMPRRVTAPNYARMQIRRVEIMRNFIAQQIEAIPENTITRRLILLRRNENESNDHSQRVQQQQQQRRSRSSRIGFRRRPIFRVRVRSVPPSGSVLQTTATSQPVVTDENNVENLRE